MYNNNKLFKLIGNPKDKILAENRKDLIYRIDCLECDHMYFGETKQLAKKRLNQHKSDIKSVKNLNKTALAYHSIKNTHQLNFTQFKIVCFEANMKSRKNIESIYITKYNQKSMNFKSDIGKIGTFYADVIRNLKI